MHTKVKVILAAFLLAMGPTAAHAVPMIIDFEAESGNQANGFSAAGHAGVTFSDSMGSDLRVASYGTQGDGRSLAIRGDDGSALEMDFSAAMSFLSLDFGNDDPGYSDPGDAAWLSIMLDDIVVDTVSIIMNRDDIMNQTISASGLFNSALFWYGDAAGNAINLIEIVDNITYDVAAVTVPEPGTLALLGIGLIGVGLARRKQ